MHLNGAARALLIAAGALWSVHAMAAESSIESLAWLAGCWQPEKGDAGSDYRLEAEGRLVARIEGMRDGKIRRIDFPMKRVSCEVRAGSLQR